LVLKLKTIHSTTSYLLTYLHTTYFYVVDHTIFEQFQTGKYSILSKAERVCRCSVTSVCC